jgi:hypothetical protein
VFVNLDFEFFGGFEVKTYRVRLIMKKLPSRPLPNSLNKYVSAPTLLNQARKAFEKIPDARRYGQQFSLPDVLMSGLAVFGLKFPSLLKFDEQRNEERIRANLKSLYGVKQAPCDTQLRSVCDQVNPAEIRAPFIHINQRLYDHHFLEGFRYLEGFLVSIDGTGQFASSSISCPQCCARHHRNGETGYYHQLLAAVIVHPDQKQVLPLFPEAITHQDGETKNDCELNASKRLVKQLREAFPNWPICVVEDSLFANGPHIKLLKELKVGYIISVKPDGQESMFDEVKNRVFKNECEEFEVLGEDQVLRGYRWINDIPLNKSHPDLLVNFLDYWEIREGKEFNFSWVTDIKLNTNNVHPVMKGGRSRWHIENQTFNTLKNQDYEFEHNFGHGQQYLATVFAMLMMLAFLIDQVQEYGCAFFQAARQRFHSRTSLWIKIKGLFTEFFIESWEALWRAIIYGHGGGALQPNTS